MFARLARFFKPPEFEGFEKTQKARFLHYSLLVSTGACIILGKQNSSGNTPLGGILFIGAVISFLCIPFNKRGFYTPVAIFASGLILSLITFSLAAGLGLRDAGMAAYPIFIVFSSYLFSKRAVIITIFFSIVSLLVVFTLEKGGFLKSIPYSLETQLVVMLVLLPAAGFLLWAVTDNWERSIKNIRDTYDLTLAGWGQALEYRDRETQGHSRRVVEMTLALAVEMGIPARKLEHMRRGALLHDIGKMAIPDSILTKDGSLSEEEWEIVRKHPLYARNMLESIPYLKPAIDIPYFHHEKWNGSGYPLGLSKEKIPLAARIFSVVDVWDALTSDRPYRPAWPESKACEYILAQSGKQFDPKIVQVFLKSLERLKFIILNNSEN
jgi:HD-GYP domain-containing protein (c-di-GMP phosphodiesterase class II)